MRRFDLVLFDLDGTLLDTSEGILSSVRYIIDKAGLPPLDEAELKTFIGPPIQTSLRRRFDLTPEKAMELVVALGKIYKADGLVDITSAHLSGASYKTIGDGGLKYLEDMVNPNSYPLSW